MSETLKATNSQFSWPPSTNFLHSDWERASVNYQKLVHFTKRSFKKYFSFFYTMLQKENTKKVHQQTSSSKVVDQKISSLGFFWKQDWERGSVFRLDKGVGESWFIKKWIPGLTFIWMQYHWEVFRLAEHPFYIHLALRKVTELARYSWTARVSAQLEF